MDKEECTHPVRIHGLCANCGREMKTKTEKLFAALHRNSDVLIDVKEAEKHNEETYKRLTKERRMVLLLDLDQTVIHTSVSRTFAKYYKELKKAKETKKKTEDAHKTNKSTETHTKEESKAHRTAIRAEDVEESINEIEEINIEGFAYYVKKRDNLQWFLAQASKYFEIHIYTMGNKEYGNTIARMLDKDGSIFGTRIVTRDDNTGSYEKDLARIFPTNTKNVVILDDRPDVWGFSKNILPIRPYTYFRSGDINNPDTLRNKKGSTESSDSDRSSDSDGDAISDKNKKNTMSSAEHALHKIYTQCIAHLYDNELERIMRSLISIHTEYFDSTQKDIVQILQKRKNVFAGCTARFFASSFEAEKYLSCLFVHHGGAVDMYVTKRTTHVVMSDNGVYLGPPKSNSIQYVSVSWVYESVFMLERQNESKFVREISIRQEHTESEIDTESGYSETDTSDSLYNKIVGDS